MTTPENPHAIPPSEPSEGRPALQPAAAEEVARELHANGVHTKCPADCLARWDGAGNDVIPGYGIPGYGIPGYGIPAASPARHRRRPLLLGIGVLVVLIGLVLGGVALFGGFGPSMHLLTIHYGLIDAEDGGNCSDGGSGGYSDVGPGMPVTVKDETGKIIASTELPDHGEESEGADVGCIWTMKVPVPDDAEQYGIEGGRRGTVTFSHSELARKHWVVQVGLGA